MTRFQTLYQILETELKHREFVGDTFLKSCCTLNFDPYSDHNGINSTDLVRRNQNALTYQNFFKLAGPLDLSPAYAKLGNFVVLPWQIRLSMNF